MWIKCEIFHDKIFVKRFVRCLHEIFCVVLCRLFCVIFREICSKIIMLWFSAVYNFKKYFVFYFFWIFHISRTRTECFNNSTYLTILYTLQVTILYNIVHHQFADAIGAWDSGSWWQRWRRIRAGPGHCDGYGPSPSLKPGLWLASLSHRDVPAARRHARPGATGSEPAPPPAAQRPRRPGRREEPWLTRTRTWTEHQRIG